jgi:hypothetical protein
MSQVLTTRRNEGWAYRPGDGPTKENPVHIRTSSQARSFFHLHSRRPLFSAGPAPAGNLSSAGVVCAGLGLHPTLLTTNRAYDGMAVLITAAGTASRGASPSRDRTPLGRFPAGQPQSDRFCALRC